MNKDSNNGQLLKGQIIKADKDRYIVEIGNRKMHAEVSGRIKHFSYQKSDFPVVGDYVYFRDAGHDFGIIERIATREKVISRLDVGGVAEEHILASNVDLIFVCMSLNNDFNLPKLQNLMTLTYVSDIETIILLTKKDLADNIDSYLRKVSQINKEEIMVVSSYDENDIEILKDKMKDKTAVFLGSSGVGKSTIINALCGEEVLETSKIRESDSQGRHTTTHRELIHLPSGGKVIDTPGLRIITSYFTDEKSFSDIMELAEGCQFRNCTHTIEPNCNVLHNLYEGTLPEERYNQYLKAVRYNKFNQKRQAERQKLQNKRKKY